jgi:hypothetical protein
MSTTGFEYAVTVLFIAAVAVRIVRNSFGRRGLDRLAAVPISGSLSGISADMDRFGENRGRKCTGRVCCDCYGYACLGLDGTQTVPTNPCQSQAEGDSTIRV